MTDNTLPLPSVAPPATESKGVLVSADAKSMQLATWATAPLPDDLFVIPGAQSWQGEKERLLYKVQDPQYITRLKFSSDHPFDPNFTDISFRPYIKAGEIEGTIDQIHPRPFGCDSSVWHSHWITPPLRCKDATLGILGNVKYIERMEQRKPPAEQQHESKLAGRFRFILNYDSKPTDPGAADADGNSVYMKALWEKFQAFKEQTFAALCHPDAVQLFGVGPEKANFCKLSPTNPVYAAAQARRKAFQDILRKDKQKILQNDPETGLAEGWAKIKAMPDGDEKTQALAAHRLLQDEKIAQAKALCDQRCLDPGFWKEVMDDMKPFTTSFIDHRTERFDINCVPEEQRQVGHHTINGCVIRVGRESDGQLFALKEVPGQYTCSFEFPVFTRNFQQEEGKVFDSRNSESINARANKKRKDPPLCPIDLSHARTRQQRLDLQRVQRIEGYKNKDGKQQWRYTPIPTYSPDEEDLRRHKVTEVPVPFNVQNRLPDLYLEPSCCHQIHFKPIVKFNLVAGRILVRFDAVPFRVVYAGECTIPEASAGSGTRVNPYIALWAAQIGPSRPLAIAPPSRSLQIELLEDDDEEMAAADAETTSTAVPPQASTEGSSSTAVAVVGSTGA
jgi:hypothetical protein